MAGNPNTPSNAFDVVVCEQVLEHLPRIDLAIAALERMAKPGGKVCVGVPIFLSPAAFARDAWVQASLILRPQKKWSHIQTFSQRSFLRAVAPPFASRADRDARVPRHLRRICCARSKIIAGGGASIGGSARWRPGRASRFRRFWKSRRRAAPDGVGAARALRSSRIGRKGRARSVAGLFSSWRNRVVGRRRRRADLRLARGGGDAFPRRDRPRRAAVLRQRISDAPLRLPRAAGALGFRA